MTRLCGYLSIVVCLGLVAGCGPSQTSATLPATLPTRATGSGSLLYVAEARDARKLSVYTFPGGSQQKSLLFETEIKAHICTDDRGDIFAPAYGVVFEYAHGGHRPIAQLQDKGATGQSCAADPKTGNVAVINDDSTGSCAFAIYKRGQKQPTILRDTRLTNCDYPSYDARGDLFFYGGSNNKSFFAELPAGGSRFVDLSLNQSIANPFGIQWDGTYLAIQAQKPGTLDQPVVIFRVRFSGTKGTIVQTLRFKGWTRRTETFWIQGNVIIAPLSYYELALWNYPGGGKATQTLSVPQWYDYTVSVAP